MVLSPTLQVSDMEFSKSRSPQKVVDILSDSIAPTVSFEYFPPKTEVGLANLQSRIHSMADMHPAWIDVTFGAGGSSSATTLAICAQAVEKGDVDVMMHLTCTNMKKTDIDNVLEQIHAAGIRNILALRGDPPSNVEEWVQCEGGFSHAVDLVRYIRCKYGDYFCIGVAGYPEGHTDCESKELDLMYLKEKVDAGADLVVTQLFYDNALFFEFIENAKRIGITCPIIPGIMPIMTYAGFTRMTTMCKTYVPPSVLASLEAIKDDGERVAAFGVDLAAKMCMELLASGQVKGVHLYTMNNESNVRQIVRKLDKGFTL